MNARKKRAVVTAIVLAAVLAAGGAWYLYTQTVGYQARSMLAELRGDPPGGIDGLLARMGLRARAGPRHPYVIAKRLAALGKPAVPYLIEALGEDNAPVRSRCADALGEIGPDAWQAAPTLVLLLVDKDGPTASSAGDALESMGAAAVPALAKAAKMPGKVLRVAAARTLGGIGSSAVRTLVLFLGDVEPEVRFAAADGLAKIGPAADRASGALAATMGDENPHVRALAARALGKIGPGAKLAAGALAEATRDTVPLVRDEAARALGEIGPEGIAELVKQTTGEGAGARTRTAKALGMVGRPGILGLILALGDGDHRTRSYAAEALGLIGEPAKLAAANLAKALRDDDREVRAAAATALGKMGSGAGPGVAAQGQAPVGSRERRDRTGRYRPRRT